MIFEKKVLRKKIGAFLLNFSRSSRARAGPIWAHTGPYGPIWAHMGPYGFIWAHMGQYGPIWAYMGPYGPIWARMGPARAHALHETISEINP